MQVLKITRKPGVPLIPAPFYADGYPCWTAELSEKEAAPLIDAFKSGKEFKDVLEVKLNGHIIYPVQGIHWK